MKFYNFLRENNPKFLKKKKNKTKLNLKGFLAGGGGFTRNQQPTSFTGSGTTGDSSNDLRV